MKVYVVYQRMGHCALCKQWADLRNAVCSAHGEELPADIKKMIKDCDTVVDATRLNSRQVKTTIAQLKRQGHVILNEPS